MYISYIIDVGQLEKTSSLVKKIHLRFKKTQQVLLKKIACGLFQSVK